MPPEAPSYPPAHGLLAGKTALVTAAGDRHRLRGGEALRRGGCASS